VLKNTIRLLFRKKLAKTFYGYNKMVCIEIKTKKYQTRKGPPYHAKDCKGLTKKGNNGKTYVSVADKRGIYKWEPKEKGTRSTLKKKGVKTYTMLDNGAEPFVADVSPSHVEIYRQIYKEDDGIESYKRDKKVVDTPYKKIFIGDNDLKDPIPEPKGNYPGNSILICVGPGKYIYSGHEIYSLETKDGEEIKKYYSPVGNSAVPYPYAIGENYTYFMLDKETVPNELLDLKEDAYGQFYGWTIKDEDLKKKIESSKKKFKTKMIHKRTF
jgi:hypothetical protein